MSSTGSLSSKSSEAQKGKGRYISIGPYDYLFDDQVDQLILDHDGLDDITAVLRKEGSDLVISQYILHNGIVIQVGGHQDGATHLAIDLHSDGDLVILALFLIVGRPGFESDGALMAQQLPHLLAHMGNDAGNHLDEVHRSP